MNPLKQILLLIISKKLDLDYPDADISAVKNSFMYFDFTNSANSQIVLKNGTIENTMTFQFVETDIINNIVVEFGNEIDYANVQSGLLWKANVDD